MYVKLISINTHIDIIFDRIFVTFIDFHLHLKKITVSKFHKKQFYISFA